MAEEKLTKNKAVDIIAFVTNHIAEERAQSGRYSDAKSLFLDSARKYEYLSAFRERPSALRTLQHALELSRRAEASDVVYRIAMKISSAELEPEEPIPKVAFNQNVIEHGEVVDGLPRVSEELSDSRCVYLYRLKIDKWSLAKLEERLGDSPLWKLIDESREQVATMVHDGNEGINIEFKYYPDKNVLSIFSKHLMEDHAEVKDTINMLAGSLNLLMRP